MIEIDNQTTLTLNTSLLQTILASLTQRDVELLIVNNSTITQINKEHRGIDKATDVLSFPYDMPVGMLGSIVISEEFLKKGADQFGHSVDDELALLFIHGVLHILGYDHEVDNGEMRQKEKELIEEFGLPKSLIVRTQG